MSKNIKSLNYRSAGVNIDAGNTLVERIKPFIKATSRKEVLGGLGGFGGLFELPANKYQQPVLVSGTDGVGTKLKLAIATQRYDTIGIDLVAMCVNDLIVCGAEPLFFLDYYACGKLDVDKASDVIKGITDGCQQAGCALIGGETAEMPGMYQADDYDLAGFCVGVVEKANIIDGSKVQVGDKIIALASSGPHSNGYSLIRKILEVTNHDLQQTVDGQPLIDMLLSPTKIYVQSLLALIEKFPLNGIAHITGGGLLENIPRVMPAHTKAVLDSKSWQLPTIFSWLQQQGNIEQQEMYRTFNCGVGMTIIVAAQYVDGCIDYLHQSGETAWLIGEIQQSEMLVPSVTIK